MQPKKINRSFNTWAKKRTEDGPPDDTHYSIARDRGTVKAEVLLETHSRMPKDEKTGKRPMLVPPPLPYRR